MGVGANSTNGSSSQRFSSNPVNLQNPSFTGLSPQTAQGIGNAQSVNSYGVANATGSILSPYGAYTPSGGYQGYYDPATNPLVAQMTGAQTGTLNNVTNFANSNPLGQAFGTNSNMLSPNYAASLATSPQTQSAVQAAIAPQIQAFNAQTVPGLQGMFTAAGQRINNQQGTGGSSAFDIAGANAMTGLESQIGATAGGIVNQAYQTGLGQTANAVNQAQGLSSTNVNNLINTLNANALPQLTQQYGINQGLQLYQQQVNQMLTALGLGGQVSQPAIGNIAMGSGSGSNKGGGFGIQSSARYKHDIRELRPVSFRYNHDGVKRFGFIAEEVNEVFPEIVYRNPEGLIEGIDLAQFPPLIVLALQDLEARVSALEAN